MLFRVLGSKSSGAEIAATAEADDLSLAGVLNEPMDWDGALDDLHHAEPVDGPVVDIAVPTAVDAVEAGPAERAAELREIADLSCELGLSDEMRVAAEDLLVAALDDPSVGVRMAMAEALASSPRAPRQVVLALARDVPRVAAVVLRSTPCLLDVELIQIARTARGDALRALADRRDASARLVAQLVSRADIALARRMSANKSLPLTGEALDRLIDAYGDDPKFRDRLLARPDLAGAARLRLTTLLGERLAEGLAGFAGMSRGMLIDAGRTAANLAALEITDNDETCAASVVACMREEGRLTPKLVLRAACEGRLAFLTAALARLARTSEARVVSVLSAHRSGPVDALCRRAGLPDGFGDALCAAAEILSDGRVEDLSVRPYLVAERVLARYEATARREPAIHAALRELAVEAARAEARRRREP